MITNSFLLLISITWGNAISPICKLLLVRRLGSTCLPADAVVMDTFSLLSITQFIVQFTCFPGTTTSIIRNEAVLQSLHREPLCRVGLLDRFGSIRSHHRRYLRLGRRFSLDQGLFLLWTAWSVTLFLGGAAFFGTVSQNLNLISKLEPLWSRCSGLLHLRKLAREVIDVTMRKLHLERLRSCPVVVWAAVGSICVASLVRLTITLCS